MKSSRAVLPIFLAMTTGLLADGITANDKYLTVEAAVAAGPSALPQLHRWLQDPDYQRRILAAKVCGELHDPSSLQPLMEACRTDNGLALGAIVTSLGELRDPAALPVLTAIFPKVDRTLGPIWAMWGNSPPVWMPNPASDPRGKARRFLRDLPKGSRPVFPSELIQAFQRISFEQMQPFLRTIYRDPGALFSRELVALGLRPVEGPEQAENVAILHELLKDPAPAGPSKSSNTAYSAAVTLLRFDLRDGETIIRDHLSDKEFSYWGPDELRMLLAVPHHQRSFIDERLHQLREAQKPYVQTVKLLDELLK